MSSPFDAANAARATPQTFMAATPLTALKPTALVTHLPRCQHPLLFRRTGRDPASDPFGDAFSMPWLEWEKYLPGVRGSGDGLADLEMAGAGPSSGMVFGPRRGILETLIRIACIGTAKRCIGSKHFQAF